MDSAFKSRRSERSKVGIAGFYHYSSQWVPCTLYDLSLEGAGLKINQSLVKGDSLKLKFGLGDDKKVVQATVANVDGTRVGVMFVLDQPTQDFLKNIIQAYQRPNTTRRQP